MSESFLDRQNDQSADAAIQGEYFSADEVDGRKDLGRTARRLYRATYRRWAAGLPTRQKDIQEEAGGGRTAAADACTALVKAGLLEQAPGHKGQYRPRPRHKDRADDAPPANQVIGMLATAAERSISHEPTIERVYQVSCPYVRFSDPKQSQGYGYSVHSASLAADAHFRACCSDDRRKVMFYDLLELAARCPSGYQRGELRQANGEPYGLDALADELRIAPLQLRQQIDAFAAVGWIKGRDASRTDSHRQAQLFQPPAESAEPAIEPDGRLTTLPEGMGGLSHRSEAKEADLIHDADSLGNEQLAAEFRLQRSLGNGRIDTGQATVRSEICHRIRSETSERDLSDGADSFGNERTGTRTDIVPELCSSETEAELTAQAVGSLHKSKAELRITPEVYANIDEIIDWIKTRATAALQEENCRVKSSKTPKQTVQDLRAGLCDIYLGRGKARVGCHSEGMKAIEAAGIHFIEVFGEKIRAWKRKEIDSPWGPTWADWRKHCGIYRERGPHYAPTAPDDRPEKGKRGYPAPNGADIPWRRTEGWNGAKPRSLASSR